MKRVICLLLSLILMLTVTACGKTESKTPGPVETPKETEAATQSPTEADVSAQEAVGTYENGVYDNDMLGIAAAFDENWYVATVEERLQLAGALSEVVTDDAVAETLETSGSAMDLYALQANGSNVNIMLQKINSLQSMLISEQLYVEQALGELPAAMESIQVEDAKIEAITLTFAGKEHAGISIIGVQGGQDFYEKMVVMKAGGYIASITAACYGEDVTDDILGIFAVK